MPQPPREVTPQDEHTFHLLYIAWLQCGCDTHPMNEDYERMIRQRKQPPPVRCVHGKTPLTCEKCYLRGVDSSGL